MRTIKFRGRNSRGEWVYGFVEKATKGNWWISQYDDKGNYLGVTEVDPATVGQFTGLFDKHGREIYEGDIIKWYEIGHSDHDVLEPPEDYIKECMDVVVFGAGAFTVEEADYPDMAFLCKDYHYNEKDLFKWVCNLDDFPGVTTDDMYICEVVGNIHDHPSLIEEGGE